MSLWSCEQTCAVPTLVLLEIGLGRILRPFEEQLALALYKPFYFCQVESLTFAIIFDVRSSLYPAALIPHRHARYTSQSVIEEICDHASFVACYV